MLIRKRIRKEKKERTQCALASILNAFAHCTLIQNYSREDFGSIPIVRDAKVRKTEKRSR